MDGAMTRAAMLVGLAVLAGCTRIGGDLSSDGFSSALGLKDTTPDEFIVLPRKPLTMPQTIALAEPSPGAPSRVEPTPLADARAALGRQSPQDGGPSAAEQALIAAVGADAADPAVREALTTDGARDLSDSPYGLEADFGVELTSITRGEPLTREEQEAEAARLRAQGLTVPNTPEAPTE
jgi:hypothetical protein